jgi:hypothetical protein
MVDRNALFDRNNSHEVNPTVEGSDDRPPSDDSVADLVREADETKDEEEASE